MAPELDLRRQARDFADRLTRVLNTSITDGIRLSVVMQDDASVGWIGYRISKQDTVGVGIPVTIGGAPSCFLHVAHTLGRDPEEGFLLVRSGSYGVYLDPAPDGLVFHYDYVREPGNPFPVAHLQIAGQSETLDELNRRTGVTTPLERLHFPVGGKRFRPTLEDVIEFLIVEGYATKRDGWEVGLAAERDAFQRLQLKAAVRRDPHSAVEELERQGYRVHYPDPR